MVLKSWKTWLETVRIQWFYRQSGSPHTFFFQCLTSKTLIIFLESKRLISQTALVPSQNFFFFFLGSKSQGFLCLCSWFAGLRNKSKYIAFCAMEWNCVCVHFQVDQHCYWELSGYCYTHALFLCSSDLEVDRDWWTFNEIFVFSPCVRTCMCSCWFKAEEWEACCLKEFAFPRRRCIMSEQM